MHRVYSLKVLTGVFIVQNNFESLPNPTYKQCRDFLEFRRHPEFATEVIFQKTLSHSTGNSEFLFSQRAGTITASNFLKNMPHERDNQFQKYSTAASELPSP